MRKILWLPIAVAAGLAAHTIMTLTASVDAVEVRMVAQSEVAPGAKASLRAHVVDGERNEPIAGAAVQASLVTKDGKTIALGEATTDSAGHVVFSESLPSDVAEGDAKVQLSVRSSAGSTEVSSNVAVRRRFKVLVSSDKPRYQPGQTIHLRALCLSAFDLRPAAERPVVLEVHDPKGNKVFKKKLKTSAFGNVAADFVLANQVNLGNYDLVAIVGDVTSRRSVLVERYTLPKFAVKLSTDRPYYTPGGKVRLSVAADYTFGKPVAKGEVKVVAKAFVESFRTFAELTAKTDDEGRAVLEVPLAGHFVGQPMNRGNPVVLFETTVRDPAGYELTKAIDVPVAADPIRVDVVAESGQLVTGVENTIYVVTTYPDGRPAKTVVEVRGQRLETSDAGVAELRFVPKAGATTLSVSATDAKGANTRVDKQLAADAAANPILLRSDRAVYDAGGTMKLEILSKTPTRRAFVDVVHQGRTALLDAVDVVAGRASLAVDLPPDLAGTIEVHAYSMDNNGVITRDARVVQVRRPSGLSIDMALDRETYRPGEKATLSMTVKKGEQPVASAVSLAGVDEAVYVLSDLRPGLAKVFFEIEAELLVPRYELHAHLSHDDHKTVVHSAVEPPTPPKVIEGETYEQRCVVLDRERDQLWENLLGVLFVLPTLLFVWLVGGVARLGRESWRAAPTVDKSADVVRFGRRMIRRWFYGLTLPLVAAAIAGSLASWRHRSEWSLAAAVTVAVIVLLTLVRGASIVRPFGGPLARAASRTPVVYFVLPLAISGLVAVSEMRPPWFPEMVRVVLGWTLFAAAVSVAGFLSLAVNGLHREDTGARYLWVLVRSTLWLLIPAATASLFLVTGRSMQPNAVPEMLDRGLVLEGAMFKGGGEPPPAPAGVAGQGGSTGEEEGPRVRSFFPETLLWAPEILTDDQGRASLEIPLADSITTWRLAASAVDGSGALGASDRGLVVFQDFFVDIDFPVALTQNDRISVPIAVFNYLDEPQEVRLEAEANGWATLIGGAVETIRIRPKEVRRVTFALKVNRAGRHAFTVRAIGSRLSDAVRREVDVKPDGEPVVVVHNGDLTEPFAKTVSIPKNAIDGANDLVVKIYPGSFSQVLEGLDGIFRMPSGCFEQTSSSTYPNVLVLDYMRRTKQIKPEIETKALSYINTGYQRLLSYEVDGGGFEWFGKAPAHTILTAYGLMEFADMAKVYDIDEGIVPRTQKWLLSQQQSDGHWDAPKGGIAEGAINRVKGAAFLTTAYIAWAIAETGSKDPGLSRALDWLKTNASDAGEDPYNLALTANAFIAAERNADAAPFIERLVKLAVVEGEKAHFTSKGQGATYSSGKVMDIETTAVAAYALIRSRSQSMLAKRALRWLMDGKDQFGTWSSTQATIHTMRALLAGSGGMGELEKPATVKISVGDAVRSLDITPETSDVYRLVSLTDVVRVGDNEVRIEGGTGALAFQVVATHYVPRTKKTESGPPAVSIDVTYDTKKLATGDTLEAKVSLAYNRPGAAKMILVDLGLPPGFTVDPASFESLKAEGIITRYDLTARQAILYFTELRHDLPVSFTYRLKAKFPVKAKTPVSTVYEYYKPESRDEAEPVLLEVR